MEKLVTRIAPTPSGYLHMGNAYSFILTWLIARKNNGTLFLRIDDLDQVRTRKEYIEDIFDSIHWLGIDYDCGPTDPLDFKQEWSQTLRLDLYNKYLQKLVDGDHVFTCDCSRASLLAMGEDHRYPDICYGKNLPLDKHDSSLRLLVPENTKISVPVRNAREKVNLSEALGSFVVRRREGIPAYQLVSLVDDEEFGVNYIVRGADLLSSSAAQIYISKLLKLPGFSKARFLHHPLIKDLEGKKMSKSLGAESLKAIRDSNLRPIEVFRSVAQWLGMYAEDIYTAQDLLDRYRLLD